MLKLCQKITLHPPPSQCLPANGFTNADMDPVPFKDRTWAWYDAGGFWVSEGFQIPVLQMAGSLVANGLSPGMAMGAVMVGNVLVMIPCALNGYAGAATGVNFPVISRASWRWRFEPSSPCSEEAASTACSPPSGPPSRTVSPTTSGDLLCFFLFWLLTLPFLAIPVSALRWLFRAKLLLMPITGLTLFTWAVVQAHGLGPIFHQPSSPPAGYSTTFLFFSAITSVVGPQATFALNMGDFCRYAKHPRYSSYAQSLMMPLCLTLTAFLGIVLSSSSTTIFALPAPEWDPLALLDHFDSRAAQFVVSLLFAFATLCTNIAGNSVAFGNDLTSLFPGCINIRRGQFLCAVLGVAVTPWNILNSATTLLTFLNGYAVFLGALCGILLADYWILRRRHGVKLGQLYQPHGAYWFVRGWNFRAVAAFFFAIAPNLPGLVKSVAPGIRAVPRGFEDVYTMSWLVSLVIAASVYLGFSVAFPPVPMEIGGAGSEEEQDHAVDWLYSSAEVTDLDQEHIRVKPERADLS
ncbi:permease for cytosine/purines, uracil, thiamine, allantoin-domain-containing protein [Aspergillus multicolor]|uniref:permease for cytosine/purines, uracil, thiamine, allantoin-domain-containing protein n=1 Tax=Aspergillus multicolor TaxID=41759 RepID=UPI003CCE2E97